METLLQNNILKHIHIQIINKNIEILKNIHLNINKIYNSINEQNFIINNVDETKYKFIMKQLIQSQLYESKQFKSYIDNINKIIEINYENIYFYVLDDTNTKKAISLFKIAYSFSKYKNITNNIIIIWVPINKTRIFEFNNINQITLQKSIDNFNAFTVSGTTINNITIITRYEEIEKLLLHELIHNYNIDGSKYYKDMKNIIIKYEKNKNPNNFKYDFCIYESYTELLSSYFSMIFRNINNFNRIETEIIMEILYSYNTVCNIIKLNGYTNINEFLKIEYFNGDICFYEYYYLKSLLYNNFVIEFGDNINDFINIYEKIINVKNDSLLIQIFNNCYEQKIFKYIYY